VASALDLFRSKAVGFIDWLAEIDIQRIAQALPFGWSAWLGVRFQ
jgi:hypothetical protein